MDRLIVRSNMLLLFQDLDKKLSTLVVHSSDVCEETDGCKRYGSLEILM